MKWDHPNVGVACLSAEEAHTPPGYLQDKSLPPKTFKNHKIEYQKPFWKLPEILGSKEKSTLWCASRALQNKHNAKRINSFEHVV